MQNIYLVRHGESLANVDMSIHATTPDHAIALSERGHRQAQVAGAALVDLLQLRPHEKVRVWNSPYLRTRQTAKHIKDAVQKKYPQVDSKEHINLCEQQFGLFDGLEDAERDTKFPLESEHYKLAERFEGRFWARMPLGESRFDVAVRVHQAFGTFQRDSDRHDVNNIIIVCHGVTMRAFIMQWFNLPFEWFEAQKNPNNCDIYHIEKRGKDIGEYVYRTPENL